VDLRQLDHFVAVAEEQNFTRAARRVHIVQSALSTSIRTLEEELGTSLFRRGARHVTLTTAGEVMLDRARRVLKDVRDAREAVASVDGLVTGSLSVCSGLIQCLNPFIDVVDLLARFHEKYPGVLIRLRQVPTEPSLEELRFDRAEIALVAMPEPLPAGFEGFRLAHDRLVFICNDTSPLADRKSVRPADLQQHFFVDLTRQWHLRRRVDEYCRSVKLHRHVSCEVNELATFYNLVAAGIGVAITPRRLAMQYREHLRIIDLSPAAPSVDYGAVIAVDRIKQTRRLNAAARAFLAMIEPSQANEKHGARRSRAKRSEAKTAHRSGRKKVDELESAEEDAVE
jgi:DNA-binding transcriptional LysR family regulator